MDNSNLPPDVVDLKSNLAEIKSSREKSKSMTNGFLKNKRYNLFILLAGLFIFSLVFTAIFAHTKYFRNDDEKFSLQKFLISSIGVFIFFILFYYGSKFVVKTLLE